MNKYYGIIGYSETQETTPGVWTDVVTERHYYGDILNNRKRWETSSESINDDLNISNSISIIADPYAYQHFYAIKFIEWNGILWKVTEVEVQQPRLILSIGGVYNGPRAAFKTSC